MDRKKRLDTLDFNDEINTYEQIDSITAIEQEIFVTLRDLRGVEESTHLFLHRAERQHDFAEHFIEHLRESGVDRREAANDSFIASRMLKAGAGAGEIADGKQKEKNRERAKDSLQRAVQP